MRFAVVAAMLGLIVDAAGCLPSTSEAAFVGSRSATLCQGVYQQCKGLSAGCKLDEDEYIEANFPGTRKILVETPPGEWKIRISLFLDPQQAQRAPGVDTEVFWYEPGCADVYHFQLSKDRFAGDLFEQAGPDNVFDVEQMVHEYGDHLVEVTSDATTRYLLRADVIAVK